MQEYLYILWDFHKRGGVKAAMAMLARCDLRHVAQQELDVLMDDPDTDLPWLTGSGGSVRLKREDPRIPRLLAELKAAGIKPSTRVDRLHSKKDREAGWLLVTGISTMVLAGNRKGQVWDFPKACAECGAGAVPAAPLVVTVGQFPKQGWVVAVPYGLVVVSAELAATLVGAGLTGFVVEPVRTPSRQEIDGRYRWLRIPCELPDPAVRGGCHIAGTCAGCGRRALRGRATKEAELCFERAPARDFNAWQGTVLPEERCAGVEDRPTGASLVIVISQRAYGVLKGAGVKALRCEPVGIG